MPKALERKLKKRYGKDSSIPYKIMNKAGLMRGSKVTAKGRKAEIHSRSRLRGLGGEVRRPATRSHVQGKSFAENLTGRRPR